MKGIRSGQMLFSCYKYSSVRSLFLRANELSICAPAIYTYSAGAQILLVQIQPAKQPTLVKSVELHCRILGLPIGTLGIT